jgi:PAS domain S-box-containing protein
MNPSSPHDPFDFTGGVGAVATRLREIDWRTTSPGDVARWPSSLKFALALMLRSPAPMCLMWGREGTFFYNDAYIPIVGARHPAVLGMAIADGWPEVAAFNANVIQTVLQGGHLSYREEHLLLLRNGEPEDVWLDIDFSPIIDDTGRAVGTLALVNDATHRVQAEDRLRVAQEAGGIGTFEWFPDTGKLEVSDQYRRVWGLDAHIPVTQELLLGLVHPDDRDATGTVRLGWTNPLEYTEYRRIDPDTGKMHWIARKGEAIPTTTNGRTRYLGMAHDITDRREVEDALRASELRWRSLFEQMQEGFFIGEAVRDAAGDMVDFRFVELNPAFEKQTSLPNADTVGRTMREIVPTIQASLIERYAQVVKTGEPAHFEVHVPILADRVFEARARAIGDDRFAVLFVDISERKAQELAISATAADLEERVAQRTAELLRAQDALRQSQKMESIGNLTGGVAHDFNNLLQVISGNLQLLGGEIQGNERAERRVHNAMAGVARGSKLAAQLLAFGRRQPLAPKVVNVGRFIRDMDDLLRRAIGEAIEVETIIAGGLWNTLLDPGNVENALLNLAINARDAMDGQGKLTIEAGNASLDADYCLAHAEVTPGQYVMVAVTDTGTGMTPDIIDKVFEPFFTTKPEGRGTGLGLSMVYGFVKQSGGHIKVYSEPGHGSTIKLYLPRSIQSEDVLTDIDAGPVTGGSETVLVAEDDEAVRETVVAMLGELGYRVLKARDAQSALSIIESGIPIDLLFTDVVMPGSLKSPELARKARQRQPQLAVLFTSGYTENSIVHGGRLDEGVELLSKPYSRETMARRLRAVLDSQAQRNAAILPEPVDALSAPLPPRPDRTLRILVCEDDWLIRMSTIDMLRDHGHYVLEAEHGPDAVALVETHAIDLLLTDVGLPGMSGVQLAEQLRRRIPALPVLYATGHYEVQGMQPGERSKVIHKPYGVTEILQAIETFFPGTGSEGLPG